MFTIKDYRNGRYQGYVNLNKPHGVGIFMNVNLTFIIAQWQNGQIQGKCIAIYPDGSTFCGQIKNQKPTGVAMSQLQTDYVKVVHLYATEESSKVIVIAPLQNKIVQIGIKEFQILKQIPMGEDNQQNMLHFIATTMNLSDDEARSLENLSNCYTFFQNYFCHVYNQKFQELIITINGYKQYWMGYREKGLGIRLQPVKNTNKLNNAKSKRLVDDIHRCLQGKVYMIRQMGVMTRQNTLIEYGLRSTNELLKGFTIEQGIFQLPHTLTKYQSTTIRPQKCIQTFINHLKRSLYYQDKYIQLNFITEIKQLMKKVNKQIVNHQNQAIAHNIIENPNKNIININQTMANAESRQPNVKSREKKDLKQQNLSNKYHLSKNVLNGKQLYSRLIQVKKQIYSSIQHKRSNKNLAKVDYSRLCRIDEPHLDNQKQVRNSPNQKQYKNEVPMKAGSKQRQNGSITPKKRQNTKQFHSTTPQLKLYKNKNQVQVKEGKSQGMRKRPAQIMRSQPKQKVFNISNKIVYRQEVDRQQKSLQKNTRKNIVRGDEKRAGYAKNNQIKTNARGKKKILTELDFVF